MELWHNDLRTSTSSPILEGDRIYLTSEIGNLAAVDAQTGNILWKLKLGIEQRNSCPLYADGKLYVPILNDPGKEGQSKAESGDEASGGNGAFYIVKPGDADGKIISHRVLDGRCFGSPAVAAGRVYVQTSRKLYCFGQKGKTSAPAAALPEEITAPMAKPKHKQRKLPVVSVSTNAVDLFLLAGFPHPLHSRIEEFLQNLAGAHGKVIATPSPSYDGQLYREKTVQEVKDTRAIQWASYIPPTARVRAVMKASFNPEGKLVAAPEVTSSAGAFEGTFEGLKGYFRGRVLPGLPIRQDFESFALSETTTNSIEPPTPFAYPPLPWIGARFKFEVRDKEGNKVLTKTIDNRFFQRATVFMGDPALRDYTIEADVMSDGNRRKMSEVGVINQRYLVLLKGNEQKLEINSNQELFRVAADFKWSPNVWYHLKARVDEKGDATGVVRAKAWKKGDPEPEGWTLEAPTPRAHASGCPGLFGFSPQDMRVYIDNVTVTANK